MEFSICIDVDDVDRAVEFYGRGLGLTVVEQHPDWAQVKLGDQTCWIMKAPPGRAGTNLARLPAALDAGPSRLRGR